ncbi:hypothetical protein D3C83_100860 [compost metagenome]
MEAEHDARLLEQVEQRLPAGVLEPRLGDGDLQVGLAAAALFGEALQLLEGGLRMGRKHGDADQALGRGGAEILV